MNFEILPRDAKKMHLSERLLRRNGNSIYIG